MFVNQVNIIDSREIQCAFKDVVKGTSKRSEVLPAKKRQNFIFIYLIFYYKKKRLKYY